MEYKRLEWLHDIVSNEMLTSTVVLAVVAEWILYLLPSAWKVRRFAVGLPLVMTAFGVGALTTWAWNGWCVFLIVVAVFRIINLLRIAKGRMHEVYLKRTTRRSGFILGSLQLLFLVAAQNIGFDFSAMLMVFVFAQIVFAVGILITTIRNIHATKHRPALENFSDKELPTVTVAIPARNETADLEDCLHSVIANNYPKFEVLVLDDCSHDRTPDIIKQFAQDGVRFVKGDEPRSRWLAKNQAYDKLADEANGEIMLFCGVDVRFGSETIRALVTTLLSQKNDMISVLPRRMNSDVLSAFIQPMRYWWELALPRGLFNRPPVLSTCWVIRRGLLQELGGFDAVQHAILPEGYFAREAVKNSRYSFVRADDILDVQTRKSLPAQRATAVRVRYPQLRRRLEWVMLLSVAEVMFMVGPFVVASSAFWLGAGIVQIVAAISCALLVLSHVSIVQVSNPANTLVAAFNLPVVVLVELFLGLTSMYKYEFSTVDWRGRNICTPVMHVEPRLPAIDETT